MAVGMLLGQPDYLISMPVCRSRITWTSLFKQAFFVYWERHLKLIKYFNGTVHFHCQPCLVQMPYLSRLSILSQNMFFWTSFW